MERRAYICLKCDPPRRDFMGPGEKEPRCPQHGKMIRQTNRPYKDPRPAPGTPPIPPARPRGRGARGAGKRRSRG